MIGSSFGLDFLKLRVFPGLRDEPIRFIVDGDRLYKLVLREAEFEPKKNSFDVRGDPCDRPKNGCIRIFLASEGFQYGLYDFVYIRLSFPLSIHPLWSDIDFSQYFT